MQKVILIGPGGSGKSTLAKHIGCCLGLPVIHLDSLYWKPGWIKTSQTEWEKIVLNRLSEDRWVMDGNFGGTLDKRLAAADTVIFFDLSPFVCTWRVIIRRLKYRNTNRPDMREGCLEKLDWEFIKWIWGYRKTRRSGILSKLKSVEDSKRVIILNSLASVRRFETEISGFPT